MSGNVAVIGSFPVSAYTRTGTSWTRRVTVTVPRGPHPDYSARGLAVSGNTVLVGVLTLHGPQTGVVLADTVTR